MITVSKLLLIPALERCARVAPSKGDLSYLSHVKIEHDDVLTYSATNLVTSIRGCIDATGEAARFTVNVRDLLAAAQSVIGDNVKLSVDKNGKLTVKGEGKRLFTCKTLSADDFPAVTLEENEWVDLPGESLRNLVSRVMFAVGSEKDERPNLKCVRVRVLDGILSAAGANGHALGFASDAVELTDSITAIVPRNCIGSLLASEAETVGMSVSNSSISFRTGPEIMIVRTVADPDTWTPIEAVMDQYAALVTKSVTVSAPAILESLAAIRRTDSGSDLELTFSDGELKIESGIEGDGGYAVDTVESLGDGDGKVRLPAEYLTGALKSCQNVTIKYGVELDPFTITDGMFTAIIMPLKKNP